MGKCKAYATQAEARKNGNATLSSTFVKNQPTARTLRHNLRSKIAEHVGRKADNRPRSKADRRQSKGRPQPTEASLDDVGDISTWAPKPDGNEIEEDVPDLAPASAAPKAKRKKYTGEEASKLEDAVKEWDGLPWDGYRKLHPTHGKISANSFAKLKGYKLKLFEKYACNDKSKRRKLGGSVGRPTDVTYEISDVMAAVIIRSD